MKRKDYEKPTMQVVKLEQQYHILAGSDVQATMKNDGLWVEEDI